MPEGNAEEAAPGASDVVDEPMVSPDSTSAQMQAQMQRELAPSPVVLQGLLEMKRKGLGALAGYKLMMATVYTSGDFILAKAKQPEKHVARVNINDTERASCSSTGGREPTLLIRWRPSLEDKYEDFVLRQPKVGGSPLNHRT